MWPKLQNGKIADGRGTAAHNLNETSLSILGPAPHLAAMRPGIQHVLPTSRASSASFVPVQPKTPRSAHPPPNSFRLVFRRSPPALHARSSFVPPSFVRRSSVSRSCFKSYEVLSSYLHFPRPILLNNSQLPYSRPYDTILFLCRLHLDIHSFFNSSPLCLYAF